MRSRPTARLILLDEHGQVLLFRYVDPTIFNPDDRDTRPFWATPGGAVEDGESYEDAARRELREEAGMEDADLGPCLGTQDHVLSWKDEPIRFQERSYLASAQSTDIYAAGMSAEEREVLREHRWWRVGEIRVSEEVSTPWAWPTYWPQSSPGRYPATRSASRSARTEPRRTAGALDLVHAHGLGSVQRVCTLKVYRATKQDGARLIAVPRLIC